MYASLSVGEHTLAQIRFAKGQQTSDRTTCILNLLHGQSSWVPSLFLSLNVEHAFDRAHWCYLHVVLHTFGLTGYIDGAIGALCFTLSARVLTSGIL